ncbi:hypothetical protein HDU76_013210 [Blyttiomyces sp. JEL0837]|nr:hypothetical protein HDU76_013210 [Blyttiomyces sp. JEL0837]
MRVQLISRALLFRPRVFARASTPIWTRLYSTRRFTEDHEWVSVSNGVGTIGITNYAQQALGDVVFVELPEAGTVVKKKETIGAVESVKAASDIYAPLSGTILESNGALADEPSLINKSPESDAWMVKIQIADEKELDGLMDETKYAEFIKE